MPAKKKMERVKGDCPNCGKDRWAYVLGEKKREWNDDEAGVWAEQIWRLLECSGCETVYFQHLAWDSENIQYVGPANEATLIVKGEYWPSLSKRRRPDWLSLMSWDVDVDLVDAFTSLYVALDHDLTVLAASGIRTVFDLATEKLGVDPALSFEEKIVDLRTQGRIGDHEREDLSVMADAGSAAMHRGWKPTPEQLDTMMTTLERFIHHSFMLKGKAAKLKEKVPPRPNRKKIRPSA